MIEGKIKLRNDVVLSDFDSVSLGRNYLLTSGNKRWKVAAPVYDICAMLQKEYLSFENLVARNNNLDYGQLKNIVVWLKAEGLLAGYAPTAKCRKASGVKNLWGRITVLPEKVTKKFFVFNFLFKKEVAIPVSVFIAAAIVYTIVFADILNLGASIYDLAFVDMVLCIFGCFIIGIFHEIGHSAALSSLGGVPGRIGAGVYFIMPVLFSDVSDAWKLPRKDRVIVDIAGLYFQMIAASFLAVINIFIRSDVLYIICGIVIFEFIFNLNPFIKLDGYWVLCDILGITSAAKESKYLFLNAIFVLLGKKRKYASGVIGKKKIILAAYLTAAAIFISYFFIMLIKAFIAAVLIFSADISSFVLNSYVIDVSLEIVVNYVSGRIMPALVFLFGIRIVSVWVIRIILIGKRLFINDK